MFAAFLLQLLFHLIERLHHFFLLLGFCITLPFFLFQLLLKFIMFYNSSQRKPRKKLQSKCTNASVFDSISTVIADSHADEGTCKHIQGLLRVNSHLNQYSAHRVMYLFSFFPLALSIVSLRSRLPTCKLRNSIITCHFILLQTYIFLQKTKGEICVPQKKVSFETTWERIKDHNFHFRVNYHFLRVCKPQNLAFIIHKKAERWLHIIRVGPAGNQGTSVRNVKRSEMPLSP